MIYITYEDLCRDVRQNLTKIPQDVCGVIGVPRSGMLPATMIAEYLNVGCASVDAVIEAGSVGAALDAHGGRRLRTTNVKQLLVVDDTCFHGNALSAVKRKLWHDAFEGYDLIFMVVYLEGPCDNDKPDIYLRDIREQAKGGPFGWAIYEWNLFHHGRLTERTLFDLDGVICVEPPDERNVEAYEAYIKNPVPLYVPTNGQWQVHICTYRLEKYREMSSEGLKKIMPGNFGMIMSPDRQWPAWMFKAETFRDDYWMLFVESSDRQAQGIHAATGKPVICIETNKLYY